jgi:hypothetical protein
MFQYLGRTRTTLLLAILLVAGVSGCRKKGATTDSPPSNSGGGTGNPITDGIGKTPARNDIQRGAEKQVDQSVLVEMAKVYIQFNTENNRSPADVNEFLAYMQGFPAQYINMLKDGWIVMVPNARLTGSTVILYEKNVYQKWNNRVAAFGDGHVATLNEPDFQAALKAGGQ